MYYRRKIILSLLQLFEGQLDKIRLQKLLFLFAQQQGKAVYDFVPFRFGCFSYSANADMTAMVRQGMLYEDETRFSKKDEIDYLKTLKPEDLAGLQSIKNLYGKMDANALMKHTYVNFPFYAINSEKAPVILQDSEWDKVLAKKPKGEGTVLFTIGYEGISLEAYLTKLIKNDVKLLVDVRNNPLSMKYGFSKSQLQKFCTGLGIQYIHLPEVGIQSEQRQELRTQADYDELFANYRSNNLSKTQSTQHQIFNLLQQHGRIALTCFEANICQCHRKHLAEAIAALPGFVYEVQHI